MKTLTTHARGICGRLGKATAAAGLFAAPSLLYAQQEATKLSDMAVNTMTEVGVVATLAPVLAVMGGVIAIVAGVGNFVWRKVNDVNSQQNKPWWHWAIIGGVVLINIALFTDMFGQSLLNTADTSEAFDDFGDDFQ
ncbi:hypothetical protein N9L66_00440 [Porticoccaceae bacterium]|nr:hypothetical protein [Porticoccaceae bacterium]MDA8682052.1 hypothetical protein [Porticoccaceae bacterium]MDA8788787.1 hypothetical protein [Porticoccaceae bacterium]MDB2343069.1 hypothetical protein [Porticoccaceae bacterium]MDB2486778.1 hypothetical protein [Porticoccaceae bacterium]